MKKITAIAAVALASAMSLSACGGGRQGGNEAAQNDGQKSGFEKSSLIGVALPKKTSENWVLAEKLFNTINIPFCTFDNAQLPSRQCLSSLTIYR